MIAKRLGDIEVLRSLQDTPAGVFQDGLVAVRLETSGLVCSDLVDRLVHPRHDVEPIQDVDGSAGLQGDDIQVRLPHVTADELQGPASSLAEVVEKAFKAFLCALEPDPEQTLEMQ